MKPFPGTAMKAAIRHPMRIEQAWLNGQRMISPKKFARDSNPQSTAGSGSSSGATRRRDRIVNGILLLDKPSGSTSNRVLQHVKRLYRARKAGHTGSLDPLASGMLPLCFGHATKISAYLLDSDKEYRVTAAFGKKTDTADADGRVIEEATLTTVDEDELRAVLGRFHGEIRQIPPMYSALKKDGKRLYKLARRGEEVTRAPRRVVIHKLELERYDPQYPVFRVACSKGTYIRTLVEDIAAAAGSLGHVASLRRLRVSSFGEHDLIGMDELEEAATEGLEALDSRLLPADQALVGWPAIHLAERQATALLHGQPVPDINDAKPGLVRVYDGTGGFLGIGEVLADGRVAPKRLFAEPDGTVAD